jgi:hypothetical protein
VSITAAGIAKLFPIGLRFGASLSPAPGATVAADIEANGTVHPWGANISSRTRNLRDLDYSLLPCAAVCSSVRHWCKWGVGFGARLRGGLQLDYTALTHSELPLTHRLEVAYRFGFQSFSLPAAGEALSGP